ncbi:mitochondrial carrier [Trametopsis cervina]|nr:mitochondrial carrier [Trametopsis cervina]
MTSTLPPLVQAFSGSVGSAAANAVVYPLDLIATRLQTTSSKKLRGFRGIVLALRHVVRSEGWHGLYDGLNTDTAATLISNFLYFYFYTFIRGFVVRRKGASAPRIKGRPISVLLSAPEELGIGFIAGVASRAISQPLSVITVRLQTQTEGEDDEGELNAEKGGPEEPEIRGEPNGVIDTVRRIYEEQGLEGFWGGFTTTIPLSMNPAITLFLFQLFQRLVSLRRPRTQTAIGTPSPGSAFLGAALSNVVAITLLYPLILAKTRLQVHKKDLKRDGDSESQRQDKENVLRIWDRALRKQGVSGLYQGLEAQITKGFVSEGVKMMIKQRIEAYVVGLYLRSLRKRK